jgi:hypothetical protein
MERAYCTAMMVLIVFYPCLCIPSDMVIEVADAQGAEWVVRRDSDYPMFVVEQKK